jgi:hypothetical protein
MCFCILVTSDGSPFISEFHFAHIQNLFWKLKLTTADHRILFAGITVNYMEIILKYLLFQFTYELLLKQINMQDCRVTGKHFSLIGSL